MELGDVPDTQCLLQECSAYHRVDSAFYESTADLVSFIHSAGIGSTVLENVLFQSREISYYAVCLDCMSHKLQGPSKSALLSAILWTRASEGKEHVCDTERRE